MYIYLNENQKNIAKSIVKFEKWKVLGKKNLILSIERGKV